jgi:predicted nucleic acid-binding protein
MEPVRRLYIDSNIFIYMFESEDARSEKLRELFLTERTGERPFLVTSELTLSETLVGAYRKGDESLIEIYSNWTTSNSHLEVGPLHRDILWGASILRAEYDTLKLPDALHLATAFAFDCTHFLSGDKRLRDGYAFAGTRFHMGNKSKQLTVLRPEIAALERLIVQY